MYTVHIATGPDVVPCIEKVDADSVEIEEHYAVFYKDERMVFMVPEHYVVSIKSKD